MLSPAAMALMSRPVKPAVLYPSRELGVGSRVACEVAREDSRGLLESLVDFVTAFACVVWFGVLDRFGFSSLFSGFFVRRASLED